MPDAAPAARGVYKPRRPQASPMFRLVSDHLQRLQTVYDERFARECGPWRPVVAQVADKFLACGVLDHGFARIRCDACTYEYLLALSCKCHYFCPSCNSVALERLTYDRTAKAVTYRSDTSRSNGGHRDGGPVGVPSPGVVPYPPPRPRHDAVLRLVCQSTPGHSAQGGARRRGRAAHDGGRAAAGADGGRPPVGGAPPKDLRGRPAGVSVLPRRDAHRRLHHHGFLDRPDPRAPPDPRLP